MLIKEYKPTSAGRRGMTVSGFDSITRTGYEKSLVVGLSKTGGRNANGRITCRHIGGGHKRKYRIIDYKRNKIGIAAQVAHIDYDPNRSARIALLHYSDGEKRYIIAPQSLRVGQTVISAEDADILPGNCLLLENIPMGTNLYNIELKPGHGGQLVRSAGTFAQLLGKEAGYAIIKMPSGETRKILIKCRATIGAVSNPEHINIAIGKAGKTRWLGIRPTVRGMAMNPVDHPHGGGEGRSKGGNHPQSPWGTPAKGYKTRNNKRTDKFRIARRKSNA